MTLEQIGPYRIVSLLGSGGMGEVYRATDTRLGRDVAIKLLLQTVASDPERIGRFRREARVAASLNHPNIAAIYGFEDYGESHFLVMELVEGRSLADRLGAGPLPIDDALGVIEQVAEGLEAAHGPALSPDGRWLAYDSNVAGSREIFVRPFPTGNGSWQISRGGGVDARWSSRGDEIVYQRDNGGTDRWLMSVRISPSAAAISAAAPVELAKLPPGVQLCQFAGERLVAIRPVAPEYAGDRVIEIVNFLDQVQAKGKGR